MGSTTNCPLLDADRIAYLERVATEQHEAINMMARALDRMADCYEHLAERLTGIPVEPTVYPPSDQEDI